ncbi:hypothetical protein GCM10009535_43090 [Streptomyces thermocarboxydovorans]|uniref:Uncharacterized protein n=1 Tax=Streptomyces thermocarboxydovorans TaxID=59298 RepID=A0ABN1HMJ0_9ACTN
MTTDTPQRTTQRPPVRVRFATRIRGRHRRPRHRKALVAAGGLALAMGAMSVVRLATTPGPADTAIGTTPVTPAVTLSPSATPPSPDRTGAPRPAQPRPTSPTALGAKDSTPLPEAAEPEQPGSAPPATPSAPSGPDTPPSASSTPRTPPQDRRPAPGPPAPPHAPSTPPPPADDTPGGGNGGGSDQGLCVPLLGVCVGGLGLDLGLGLGG